MKYLSIRQAIERLGISTRRVLILRAEGHIHSANRIDYSWAIPDGEPKPEDARIKSAKYIKRPASDSGNAKKLDLFSCMAAVFCLIGKGLSPF